MPAQSGAPAPPMAGRGRFPDPTGGALAAALAPGGVRSVFQPIVELDTGRVVAYEALARGPAGAAGAPRPAVRRGPLGRPAGRARRGLPRRRLPRRGRAGPARPADRVRQRRARGARQRAAGRPAGHRRGRAPASCGSSSRSPSGRWPPARPSCCAPSSASARSAGASPSTTSAPTRCRWPSCRCSPRTSSSSTCGWCRSAPARRSRRS